MKSVYGAIAGAPRALLAIALACGISPLFGGGARLAFAQEPEANEPAIEMEASGYDYADGSLGFFEYIGADEAVQIIEDSPHKEKVGPYQDFDTMDSTENAFNLDNMKKSISIMEDCNDLRRKDGVSDLRVDPYLVAVGQIDANYSYTT